MCMSKRVSNRYLSAERQLSAGDEAKLVGTYGFKATGSENFSQKLAEPTPAELIELFASVLADVYGVGHNTALDVTIEDD